MSWWSVGVGGTKYGPFPSSKEGLKAACLSVSNGDPHLLMPGWSHEGFSLEGLEGVVSIVGIVEKPPDRGTLPVDLFPPMGAFSRSQIHWMRSSFLGTVYRTKLVLTEAPAEPKALDLIEECFEGQKMPLKDFKKVFCEICQNGDCSSVGGEDV